MSEVSDADRQADLQAGLQAVWRRITVACERAERESSQISLIVVTKTFPASDVRLLAGLGVRGVGENKVQEAQAKADEGAFDGIRLHLIGQVQTNKAAAAARLADVVHSLDRPKLARALAAGRERAGGAPLPVLVQISLDGDPARGGVPREALADLVDCILQQPALRLAGVMGVPPRGAEPYAAFTDLARLAAQVREQAPEASMLSAGMSSDLEAAVRAGATHLRVGSAILGSRPSLR